MPLDRAVIRPKKSVEPGQSDKIWLRVRDWSESGKRRVAGCCARGDEHLGYTK